MKRTVCVLFAVFFALCVVVLGGIYVVDMDHVIKNEPVVFYKWWHRYANYYMPKWATKEPPVLALSDSSGDIKAKCYLGSHSWEYGKGAQSSLHPSPTTLEYDEEHTLRTVESQNRTKEINIDNKRAKIQEVSLLRFEKPHEMDYDISYTDNSIFVDMPDGEEYALSITVEYDQGTVSYSVKVIEEN